MSKSESIQKFRSQVFRRIGYTVGGWHLLRFSEVCDLLSGKGSLDRKMLAAAVQKQFNLKKADAEGKLDFARSLGFLTAIGDRLTISEHGRALQALTRQYGPDSEVCKAFLLKQVIDHDADLTLTLFFSMSHPLESKPAKAFLKALDVVLHLKRVAYAQNVVSLSLKRELKTLLTVRESKQKPFVGRAKPHVAYNEYICIEIPESSLAHYVRHTMGPRRGWLADLGLTTKDGNLTNSSTKGDQLLSFLMTRGLIIDDSIGVVEPDSDCLLDICGKSAVIGATPIDEQFYYGMMSATFSGRSPELIEPTTSEFLELVEAAYDAVKISAFEQAQVAAIKEVIVTPYVVKGQLIDFRKLLENAVREFPEKIYRLSSRTEAGAYISLKRRSA